MKTENAGAMLAEIAEEPGLFRDILARRAQVTGGFVELFKTRDIRRVYFSGCGSPGNACNVLRLAAESLLKVEASWAPPALFNACEDFNASGVYAPEQMLLICPAESGRTRPPVLAARRARELGIATVCTTLNPEGILAEECDVVIPKNSGEELGLPSTKGHSTGLFILLLCITEAAHAAGRITEAEYQRYNEGFGRLPGTCDGARKAALKWFEAHQDIAMTADSYRVVATGANVGTTLDAALKFIESHRRPTAAWELEEFLHGPLSAVQPHEVTFLIAGEDGPQKERLFQLHRAMKAYAPGTILVQDAADAYRDPDGIAFESVGLPFLNAVEAIVPFQVLSYAISDALGLDMSLYYGLSVRESMQPSF